MDNIQILLVEDNLDDRLLIKRGINKGIESAVVYDALNQKELNEQVAEGKFDIVVTDFNLGWTDGIQVLKLVKNKWPDCPVIMMTVMDTEEVAITAMKAGLDNYLVKSSSQFALMGEIIKTALGQKEQAQALQDAETRYQELFETVPIGLFRETPSGILINVNDTMVDMLNYPSKEELLSTKSESLYLKPGVRLENISKLTQKHNLRTWVAEFKKFGGGAITTSITAHVIFDQNGNVLYYEGYMRDISEQRRVEEALSHSEILNETIVASVNDGVLVINRDLNIVTWNKYMEEISGIAQSDVLGLPLLEIIPTEMAATIKAALQKTLDGQTINIPDTLYRFPQSGNQVWLETTFSPLRTPEKRLIGVVANLHDITQRKENETEREKLLAAEQKRSRELAALTTAATTISSNLEIQQVLDVVAAQMINLLYVDNCAIFSWQQSENKIVKEVEHRADHLGQPGENQPDDINSQPIEIAQVLQEMATTQIRKSSPTTSTAFKKMMEENGIESVLLIPLTHQERTIGLIMLEDCSSQRDFDSQEIFLAEMLGNQAAVALENARLFKETAESLNREQQLHQATREISGMPDLDAIVETTCRLMTEFTGGEFSGILLIDPETETPQSVDYYNAPADAPRGLPGTGEGLIDSMLADKKPLILDNYSSHPNALPYWQEYGVRAVMFVPLQTSDSMVGFIAIFSTDKEKKFTSRDQEQATSIGRQASVAIHKAILYEQTMRRSDELSALYDVALATGGVLDSNTLLIRLQSNIEHFLHPDSYEIYLYHEETDSYEVVNPNVENNPIYDLDGDVYPLKPGGLISEVMLQHKPIRINNLRDGDHKNVLHSSNISAKSWLGIPLISGDRLIGALSVQSEKIDAFSEEDQRFLESIGGQVSIALDNAHLFEELESAFVQTVIALANAVDVRDAYTHDHSQRIAVYAAETGKLLGLSEKELENLGWGALLHDVGKIGIPDEILLKPAELTEEEYEIIKRHPSLGAEIVAPVKKLEAVAPIIRAHQECYDGSGYPDQLHSEQIPLAARILSVVDSYVAMTDDRIYRKAVSHKKAIEELKNCSGSQFDPKVVNAFLRVLDELGDLDPANLISPQDISIASPKE
jgi:PAS domain S-box-containing protein